MVIRPSIGTGPNQTKQGKPSTHNPIGVRQDVDFPPWLLGLGVRYLTSGSDTLYILSGGRADVQQIRAVAARAG